MKLLVIVSSVCAIISACLGLFVLYCKRSSVCFGHCLRYEPIYWAGDIICDLGDNCSFTEYQTVRTHSVRAYISHRFRSNSISFRLINVTGYREGRDMNRDKNLIQWLALMGVVGTIFYFLHVILGEINYSGYNPLAQAVSDLTAASALKK